MERLLQHACSRERLVWMVRRGSSFLGMHHLFEQSAILCLDDSAELDGIPRTRFFTYEAIAGSRGNWQTGTNPLFDQLWRSCQDRLTGRWRVVASHSSPDLQRWARATGSAIYVPEAELLRRLNHKRTLFEMLDELRLPRIRGEWAGSEALPFGAWASRFALPFVVQVPVGTGGFGTAFVHNEADWQRTAKRFAGQPIWIAPYEGDLSLNINAIALPGGSVAAYPSVQLTGFDFLNHEPAMYCGNDYSATARLPRSLLEDVREQTVRVGDRIAAMGFVGLFGLDFVIAPDGTAKAVDLNPRWQGSTPLLGQAQRSASIPSLPAMALAIQAGLLDPREAADDAGRFFEPVEGAQVRIRWAAPGCQPIAHSPRTGIYSNTGQWRREGSLLEAVGKDEVLVTGDPPRTGRPVEQGAQWFRIYTPQSVLDDAGAPAEWIRSLSLLLSSAPN